MKTLSLDLRERILASYDNLEGTRQEIADRYRVSLGMVKKLLQQRKRTGDIGARHAYSGRKPIIVKAHESQMQTLLGQKPDMTLKELLFRMTFAASRIRFDGLLTPNLSSTYITNALILTPVFADLSVYFDWYLFLK